MFCSVFRHMLCFVFWDRDTDRDKDTKMDTDWYTDRYLDRDIDRDMDMDGDIFRVEEKNSATLESVHKKGFQACL